VEDEWKREKGFRVPARQQVDIVNKPKGINESELKDELLKVYSFSLARSRALSLSLSMYVRTYMLRPN